MVESRRAQDVTLDGLAAELRALRVRTGSISYAEIVRRIAVRREAAGIPAAAATPARSTVYSAFQDGRSRLDAELVREIVLALGADEPTAAEWVLRCGLARKPSSATAPRETAAQNAVPPRSAPPPPEPPRPARDAPSEPSGAGAETPADALTAASAAAPPTPLAGRAAAPGATQPRRSPGRPPRQPGRASARSSAWPAPRRPAWALPVLLLGCVLLNLCGHGLVRWFELPLFLDMGGTAVAALVFGPWHGVLVAVLSQLLAASTTTSGLAALPFLLVNVAGALVWGIGVRRFRMADSFLRFFSLNLVVALVCTLVAAPILLIGFGGSTGHGSVGVLNAVHQLSGGYAFAVFASNLFTSLSDKLITGFGALAAAVLLRNWLPAPKRPLPLVERLRAPVPPA